MTHRLAGRTILNTRPLEQALPLAKAIEKEGGRCLVLSSFNIIPVMDASFRLKKIVQVCEQDIWLFMSQYAVKYALPELLAFQKKKKNGPLIGAVGKATAAALQQEGIPVIFIPEEASSEGLLNLPEFQDLAEKKITIFRGKDGRTFLDEALKERGAYVIENILYERVPAVWKKEELLIVTENIEKNQIDLALGMSIDSLTYFFSQLDLRVNKCLLNVPWLVMSDRVANQAKKLGIQTTYTVREGNVLESLIQCCSSDIMARRVEI